MEILKVMFHTLEYVFAAVASVCILVVIIGLLISLRDGLYKLMFFRNSKKRPKILY